MILILSRQEDSPHVELVTKRLADQRKSFLVLDTTALHHRQISLAEHENEWFLVVNSSHISPKDITSTWVRRPFRSTKPTESALAEHMQAEFKCFTEGLLGILAAKDIFVLNEPRVCDPAANKVIQWDAFRRLDIPCPSTHFSNKLANIKSSRIVTKQLARKSVSDGHKDYILPTKVLGIDELSELQRLALPPLLLQELLDIQYEIRVTVVSRKVFAARIDYDSRATVDYRQLFGSKGLAITEHTLPPSVEADCLRIMDHFSLHFGCIDIAVDRTGKHWFLEINPNGQWGWIEQATGQPISQEIAHLLTTPPRAKSA